MPLKPKIKENGTLAHQNEKLGVLSFILSVPGSVFHQKGDFERNAILT
jgi:hypothetical protein